MAGGVKLSRDRGVYVVNLGEGVAFRTPSRRSAFDLIENNQRKHHDEKRRASKSA